MFVILSDDVSKPHRSTVLRCACGQSMNGCDLTRAALRDFVSADGIRAILASAHWREQSVGNTRDLLLRRPEDHMIVHFTANDLEATRQHAHDTWWSDCRSFDLDDHPDGWQRSPADPMALLAVFPELRLRPEYELQAYITYSDRSMNSLGIVWAVPAGTPQPPPEECEWTQAGRHRSAPKPPGAREHVMDVIDGSRSPRSYVLASLLGRELREFGATWHGTFWGHQKIIEADPWDDEELARRLVIYPEGGLSTAAEDVVWPVGRPTDWRATYRDDGGRPEVSFFTFSEFEIERIRHHRDIFGPASYAFETTVEETARGGFGFIV